MGTIFDKIVSGEMKSWTVWEDDQYMAFLTPFPNTPGFTVVIPKQNVGGMSAYLRRLKLLQKNLRKHLIHLASQ
jgi:diadenosine tetraphosphate (Ap4A) HIT family hydrolase